MFQSNKNINNLSNVNDNTLNKDEYFRKTILPVFVGAIFVFSICFLQPYIYRIFDKYKTNDEWIAEYLDVLKTNEHVNDKYILSLIDTDFDGIPEIFFSPSNTMSGNVLIKSDMYYYENDKIIKNVVPFNTNISLYIDKNDELVWGFLLMKHGNDDLIELYRYDNRTANKAFYIDEDVRTYNEFNDKYNAVIISKASGVINDIDVDYQNIVDRYLEIINNYNKS